MTTIPQAVTDYAARLVDARKRAYVASCIACWNQGQPFVSEWPNLAAEYIHDIQRKLRRYGLTEIQRPEVAAASPVEEWVTETVEVAPVVTECRRVTFDQFCVENGVSAHAPFSDHSPAAHISTAAKRRAAKQTAADGAKWQADRERLRIEYDAKVRNGEIAAPSRRESLERAAAGHPDNPSVQAARRILAGKTAPAVETPTVISRPNGESRILASVPEQQRLKLEAEIAKVTTARTLPDHRTYLRGKAYIGDVRGSVYDGRLQFEESIGGEKWTEAFKRQVGVAYIVDWYKKDGAKPGDYIPRTAMEARSLVATYGAEAAG